MVVAVVVMAAVFVFLVLPILVGRRLDQVSSSYRRPKAARRARRPYRSRQTSGERPVQR